MNKITIETPYGTTLEYQHYDGMCVEVKYLNCRHEGPVLMIYVISNGTHWVWEILMMLRKGSTEYEVVPKEDVFLDFRTPEHVDTVSSPRVLNCHFPLKDTPRGILEKKLKIVHVQRNPKDVFVSMYNHMLNYTTGGSANETETFTRFLHLVIGTYGIYRFYPWFKYVLEWERFSKAHPDQILTVYYEDMKEDPVREVKRMNDFLQCGRSEELISQIADACSFHNLKKANDEVKDHSGHSDNKKGGQHMYRKGQVGDWKNWFTVADNERVDKWLADNLVDTRLTFRYDL